MSSPVKEAPERAANAAPARLPRLSGETEAQAAERRIKDSAQILADAKSAAQRILERAQSQAEQVRRQAQAEGYEAGRKQAAEEAAREIATLREDLARVLQEMREEHRRYLEALRPALARLSLHIAQRFLRRELKARPDALADLVHAALHCFAEPFGLRVRVCVPAGAAGDRVTMLRQAIRALDGLDLEVVEGDRVGVAIEGDWGVVDGTLEAQARLLAEAWERRVSELPQPLPEADFTVYAEVAERAELLLRKGRVLQVVGLTVESAGPPGRIGDLCYLRTRRGEGVVPAQVVGFRRDALVLMLLDEVEGVEPGSEIVAAGHPVSVGVGSALLGRVIDGQGRPLDGGPQPPTERRYPLMAQPPSPLARRRITQPLDLGIGSVNALLTCGKGQRLGVFAGSGVGKSTLLGMIARHARAHVNVVGLVGERGREVRDFLEKDLGAEGMRRSVVVVSTSDQPPLKRLNAAFAATAIAEYFRDQGQDVLLLVDSITRVAAAQRQVGLAVGEPPATRGYTPSVFSMLPRLLERAGNSEVGTITGIYTVLVEGDDMSEPVADTARSILDGHLVLSRDLAMRGIHPAVDPLQSVSRLMPDLVDARQVELANRFRQVLAAYREAEDLINIGAYVKGSNPRIDFALEKMEGAMRFLTQPVGQRVSIEQAVAALEALLGEGCENEA